MSDRSSESIPRQVPADSATAAETRGEHFRRKAHRSGLYLYAFSTVALLLCLVALAVANSHQVEFSWVLGSSEVSLVWIVMFSAILGWLLGIVMHRPGLFRKPLVGEKGAPRVIV